MQKNKGKVNTGIGAVVGIVIGALCSYGIIPHDTVMDAQDCAQMLLEGGHEDGMHEEHEEMMEGEGEPQEGEPEAPEEGDEGEGEGSEGVEPEEAATEETE